MVKIINNNKGVKMSVRPEFPLAEQNGPLAEILKKAAAEKAGQLALAETISRK